MSEVSKEARELAEFLFTRGDGKKGTQLRLVDGEVYLSGWSEIGIAPHLQAALDAAEARVCRCVAESAVAVLIPEDSGLAERFLHDFNGRRT